MRSFIAQSKKLWSETGKRPSKKVSGSAFLRNVHDAHFIQIKQCNIKQAARREPPAVLYLLHGKCA